MFVFEIFVVLLDYIILWLDYYKTHQKPIWKSTLTICLTILTYVYSMKLNFVQQVAVFPTFKNRKTKNEGSFKGLWISDPIFIRKELEAAGMDAWLKGWANVDRFFLTENHGSAVFVFCFSLQSEAFFLTGNQATFFFYGEYIQHRWMFETSRELCWKMDQIQINCTI